ncbi:MAG: LysM peptidoglycan-binding domain-containing protein [Chloroflexi bacterium]|nr:MAG: LysM peptidoglycan-binding domain-containing protein [Chloroflexota bacterium]
MPSIAFGFGSIGRLLYFKVSFRKPARYGSVSAACRKLLDPASGPGIQPDRRRSVAPQRESDDAQERLIPFPVHTRSTGEPDLHQSQRRRRDSRDLERPAPPRRARRRRHATPWLQRNALSVVAVSVLVALLGLGFGLLQMINRPDTTAALLAVPQTEPTAVVGAALADASGPGIQAAAVTSGPLQLAAINASRRIQSSVRVLQPNYTVAAGDTLGQIAARFSTSVERVQALNNLADPRALRIGTKLVIPPPL